MLRIPTCLLVEVLRDLSQVKTLSLPDWDLLIRQARRASVLAILFCRLRDADLLAFVPEQPLLHLKMQQVVAQRHVSAIDWEVSCIEEALGSENIPVLLLKGAAYSLAKLPPSHGRLYSDVDVLVVKESIAKAESALANFGWRMEELDSYDQAYYRKWMHEIPPMTHEKRGTSIDVHHNILPETIKHPLDPGRLLEKTQRLKGRKNIYILSPVDMALHSMAHLFHEGELDHGLRDLLDLDALLRHFSENEADFWRDLLLRAEQLNLQFPLYYCLRYTSFILLTPIPKAVLNEVFLTGPKQPKLMDFFYTRALLPDHSSCDDVWTGFARWAIYIRSHYLRMPLYLLIPHLLRKAYRGVKKPANDL